jgi:flagellar biosynthetic protein FliR
MLDHILAFAGAVFIIGVKIAAPVLVTLFITDVCLGIVARTMPQMNMFIVGFQVKIGAGLLMLALSLPFFQYMFSKVFNQMSIEALQLTRGFAG